MAIVSNSQRGYRFFRDVETKLEYVGFNEAVPVRVATDLFSRIGLTICLTRQNRNQEQKRRRS